MLHVDKYIVSRLFLYLSMFYIWYIYHYEVARSRNCSPKCITSKTQQKPSCFSLVNNPCVIQKQLFTNYWQNPLINSIIVYYWIFLQSGSPLILEVTSYPHFCWATKSEIIYIGTRTHWYTIIIGQLFSLYRYHFIIEKSISPQIAPQSIINLYHQTSYHPTYFN